MPGTFIFLFAPRIFSVWFFFLRLWIYKTEFYLSIDRKKINFLWDFLKSNDSWSDGKLSRSINVDFVLRKSGKLFCNMASKIIAFVSIDIADKFQANGLLIMTYNYEFKLSCPIWIFAFPTLNFNLKWFTISQQLFHLKNEAHWVAFSWYHLSHSLKIKFACKYQSTFKNYIFLKFSNPTK